MAASTGDYIFLSIVILVIAAIALGARKGSQSTQDALKSGSDAMKKAGIHITDDGKVHIKTDRRPLTQEEIIDKHQSGFERVGDIAAKHREAFHFGGHPSKKQH
ncbi:hypothetical protein OC834_006932 [Tilletia horrida]|uniref:Uncharacterized protein n=1 Tax=Tilletia horrida TaxID=155126 RepID=A0AAN6JHG1_9BASI|nr:hypothetical protein OC842_007099 [Tilletia horrida]KAK0520704.1 hypothetical protein OC834_006932 [Tilletia horrida]KAK0522262.1 hypothetical protein OC835_006634 [Tilletia horrida]KAK0548608.1 hypothetical protein OC844_007003 [Tilletia horrida]